MQSEVSIGTLVGGFRIVSLIGEGAMGRVYLAEDVRDQRRVALEVLVPELARDERFRQRFLRESRLASRLDHPNVVPTLAFGEEDGVQREYAQSSLENGLRERDLGYRVRRRLGLGLLGDNKRIGVRGVGPL